MGEFPDNYPEEPRPEILHDSIYTKPVKKQKQIYSNSTLEVAWELGVQRAAVGKKKGHKETFDGDE